MNAAVELLELSRMLIFTVVWDCSAFLWPLMLAASLSLWEHLLLSWYRLNKSGSSEGTQSPFHPCYKSHPYSGTSGEWHISTHAHTFLTFSAGVPFWYNPRQTILSFIWHWQITVWPWTLPFQPQSNFYVAISVLLCLSLHFAGIYHLSLSFFSYISPGCSISPVRLFHSSLLLSPLPVHLRAAEAHNIPCFATPSIMTDCRPNNSRKKDAII